MNFRRGTFIPDGYNGTLTDKNDKILSTQSSPIIEEPTTDPSPQEDITVYSKPAPKQDPQSLKKLVMQGSMWALIGFGGAQAIRFVSNVILTRLLFPEAFGLMALVMVCLRGLQMFSDVGIRPCIIQNSRGDDRTFLNTAWTIQVMRGFILWVVASLIAWPVSLFYEDPRLAWLLPASALTALLMGFNSTAIITAERHLQLGKVVKADLTAAVCGTVVMIALVLLWPSVWVLVIGGIVGAITKLTMSYTALPNSRNWIAWDKSAAKELFRFGRWIFLATLLTFAATQIDRLIVGKLVPIGLLGVYNIAIQVMNLPSELVTRVGAKLILPAASKRKNLPRKEFRARMLRYRRGLLGLGIAGIAPLVIFGDLLVYLVFDHRYVEAAWMVPILCLGMWPRVLSVTSDPVLIVFGKPKWRTLSTFIKLVYMVIGIPWGFHLYGMLGVVVVVALNDLPAYVVISIGLIKERVSVFMQDMRFTAMILALIVIAFELRAVYGF